MAEDQTPAAGGPEGQPVTLEQALEYAVALHQRGKLGEAESIYRRVLEAAPEHPDVLHFLGVLLHQTGRSEEGVPMIRRAISLVPDDPGIHNNLGKRQPPKTRLKLQQAGQRPSLTG